LLTLTIKVRVSPEPGSERELANLMKRYREVPKGNPRPLGLGGGQLIRFDLELVALDAETVAYHVPYEL